VAEVGRARPGVGRLARQARLWGVDKDGAVYLSSDWGVSGQAQGSLPGLPEAFLDTGAKLFAAVHEAGIYSSADGGKTWSVLYRDPV
jgi:hypothetical protein